MTLIGQYEISYNRQWPGLVKMTYPRGSFKSDAIGGAMVLF